MPPPRTQGPIAAFMPYLPGRIEGGENSAVRVSAFTAVQVMNERLRRREVWWRCGGGGAGGGFMATNAAIHCNPELLHVPQGRHASPRFRLRRSPVGVRGPSGDGAWGPGFFFFFFPTCPPV